MSGNESLWKKKELLRSLVHLRKPEPKVEKSICPHCKSEFTAEELRKQYYLCPRCGEYLAVPPHERIALVTDEGSFKEANKTLSTRDPLEFPDYISKVERLRRKIGEEDAVVTGVAKIHGISVAIAVLDSRFLMGSMGTVVGEKIARIAEYAGKKKLPLIVFSASGGARMQEGLFSLMQMAKTSAAMERFKQAGGLYISVLCNPTTGGVSASFASLGDIMLAEPKALICFAGPRVIEQTIGEKLPEGFQRSEFLLEHGMLDRIVNRREMREVLYRILRIHTQKNRGAREE